MRRESSWMNFLVPILLALPAFTSPAAQQPSSKKRKLSRSVAIYRDKYGVPHIYGPTDASVMFGLM